LLNVTDPWHVLTQKVKKLGCVEVRVLALQIGSYITNAQEHNIHLTCIKWKGLINFDTVYQEICV